MTDHFSHNFCESRLTNYTPPEIYNSYTSLIISCYPFIYGFPRHVVFYNVACMLLFNGFASFYYHYKLDWIGKQADEISMILATYYGIWGLLTMYLDDKADLNWYNGFNTFFALILLIFNTIMIYDYLFSFLFAIYIFIGLYFIHKVSLIYDYTYKTNMFLSLMGTNCWVISEVYCNEYTQYGHVIWHFLFPLGFYRLIIDYDNLLHYKLLYDNNLYNKHV